MLEFIYCIRFPRVLLTMTPGSEIKEVLDKISTVGQPCLSVSPFPKSKVILTRFVPIPGLLFFSQ